MMSLNQGRMTGLTDRPLSRGAKRRRLLRRIGRPKSAAHGAYVTHESERLLAISFLAGLILFGLS